MSDHYQIKNDMSEAEALDLAEAILGSGSWGMLSKSVLAVFIYKAVEEEQTIEDVYEVIRALEEELNEVNELSVSCEVETKILLTETKYISGSSRKLSSALKTIKWGFQERGIC